MTQFNSMGWGMQQIVDATLTIGETGLPVYYRVQNTAPNAADDGEQLGFETPVASGGGSTDIQILPQPRVKNISMSQIMISGGKLNETSRLFIISDTFVQQIIAQFALQNHEFVWDGFPQFQGLLYEGILYAVVQYAHREITGTTVSWRIICNAVANVDRELPEQNTTPAPVIVNTNPSPTTATIQPSSVAISAFTAVGTAQGTTVPADSSSLIPAIGIALYGTAAGAAVSVQNSGEITCSGWTWTPGATVYLGTLGALTQTSPITGLWQILGTAITSTVILLNIQNSVVLA
jgi:hypothetical protein